MSRSNVFKSLLVTLLLVGSLGCDPIDQPDPLPALSTIRDAVAGTEMTVEGFISVEPGTFESSTEEAGFAIQDISSGVYIQVSSALALDLSGFSLGDRVRVTGVVGDLDQLITLTIDELSDILRLIGGFIFFPQD
ncbi:MAG: hypothetical protein HRU16_07065, partial [Planctomycetes bacterium]|nr:hypothetical protein [Planctomycetota bacterium]